MKATLFIAGVSIPKARPRVTKRVTKQGFGITYTPKRSREWERTVALEYQRQCYGKFFAKEIPLRVKLEIVMPGSGSRASIRGDWENHAKSVCDALNQVAWADDIQITEAHVLKRRAGENERAGVYVEIEQS